MGYYTSYELEIVENHSLTSNSTIIEGLLEFSEEAGYVIDIEGHSYDDTKW